MAKEENVNENTEVLEEAPGFDYKNKASFKISDKFKQYFSTKTAGGQETISNDGLVALAHIKGMWKLNCDIIQYPNADNNNTCICKAVVGGYDWDPITNEIIKVEYSDIGDASPTNCNRMVAPSFIRMASTRAIGRALRKYTNIDMLCTEELGDEDVATNSMSEMAIEQPVSLEQLEAIKGIIATKGITKDQFEQILKNTFNVLSYQQLTGVQANSLIEILNNFIVPNAK